MPINQTELKEALDIKGFETVLNDIQLTQFHYVYSQTNWRTNIIIMQNHETGDLTVFKQIENVEDLNNDEGK